MDGQPKTILVWLSGALGDTLLGYACLRALHAWAPRACITVVGRPPYLALAAQWGLVDHVLDVDGPVAGGLFGGGAEPADLACDLAVIWSSAAGELASRLRELGVATVIASPPRGPAGQHQAAYLLACLKPLRIAGRPLLPRPPEAYRSRVVPGERPLVLLHPGAGSAWKRWPLKHYRALAGGLLEHGCAVIWSCGPDDEAIRAALQADWAGGEMLPSMTVEALPKNLWHCHLVLSGDTGIAHLAALSRCPSLTLFGPTDSRRWRPLGAVARIVAAPCRCGGRWQPQVKGSNEPLFRRCQESAGESCSCLEAVAPATVLERALKVLMRARK